jgi:hypothetical protein
MDERTRDNWAKVKAALESAGKTNSPFYTRAVKILATGYDPGPDFGIKPSDFG